MDALVQLRDVRHTYRSPTGPVVALDLPALDVPAGGRLAVLGPNGSGKTTLLFVLAGLLRPDAGIVTVAGTKLGSLREHAMDRFRARTIGFLPHDNHLLEGLTAAENVMSALLFAGVRRSEHRERTAAALERTGVAHRAGHRPSMLSAGERQRVALARALVTDPRLILADEPTANLDAPSSRRLMAELAALCDDKGRTLVVVTHRVEDLPAGTDALHLLAGRPVEAT